MMDKFTLRALLYEKGKSNKENEKVTKIETVFEKRQTYISVNKNCFVRQNNKTLKTGEDFLKIIHFQYKMDKLYIENMSCKQKQIYHVNKNKLI